MAGDTHYEFREAGSPGELDRLKALREESYRSSPLCDFLDGESAERFRAHDSVATHFGIFLHARRGSTPVGYLRIVRAQPTGPLDLPLLHHLRSPAARRAFERELPPDTEIVEAGRFSLARQHRSVRLASFMVDAAIAIYRLGRGARSFLTCNLSHERFYLRKGYSRVLGPNQVHLVDSEESVLLTGPSLKGYTKRRVHVLRGMLKSYLLRRRIVLSAGDRRHACRSADRGAVTVGNGPHGFPEAA